MIRNTVYYGIKPLLPLALRLEVRRWFARRQRTRVGDIWPILPGSETKPENWPGWPEGKKFALVLTHDVERREGLAKCRQLMELEMKYGFRSSFNFVPEGDYRVSREQREELVRNGFEVGVHDLHHDGKLYRSRAAFSRQAARINTYLRDWGAAGFRSGFMLHNLDWIHDLQVQYDASTFDTDPFEPQPHGKHTIFPFWVPRTPATASNPVNGSQVRPASAGYVELPYTLPQDSTLFLLLQERHPDIWFQKLDWVARHGGMALVNVHPDYISFNEKDRAAHTYPVEIYERFLDYARSRYEKTAWKALPRAVAAFAHTHKPRWRGGSKRVCMVAYSYYKSDARVTRYAEALAEAGHEVDVLAIRGSPSEPREETVGKVRLVNLHHRFGKREKSKLSYLLPVLRFMAAASFRIWREHSRRPYHLLHIHNVPDFLVFAGWYPKLRGARVILDIHDIVPEFYASKFSAGVNAPAIRWLKRVEKTSARFADHIIISNHLWREKYAERTGADGKCSVFINNVDTRIFRPRERTRTDGKLILLFPGGLQWHQGLDIAIRAFQKVSRELPNAEFHIYGEGNMKEPWQALAAELGLEGKVRFFPPVEVHQVADLMANADLGVVPKRADSFGNEAYSTKIMEFLALGVPVVVSNTKIDRFYFDDSVVRFFESGNEDALAEALLRLLKDAAARKTLAAGAPEYVRANSWETRKRDYLELVETIAGRG